MKEIIIIGPDASELPEGFLKKLAQAVAVEMGITDDKIIVHQWDTKESKIPDSPTIDAIIQRSVDILTPYMSTDTKTTENNLCFALLTNHGNEHELLMNAIKVIATYDRPARLPTFGMRQYGINACRSIYSKVS